MKSLFVELDDAEHASLKEHADRLGLTIRAYVRSALRAAGVAMQEASILERLEALERRVAALEER